MEEFVQKFRRVMKESEYKGRLLMEEFKWGMNGVIRQKMIKLECTSKSIEQ